MYVCNLEKERQNSVCFVVVTVYWPFSESGMFFYSVFMRLQRDFCFSNLELFVLIVAKERIILYKACTYLRIICIYCMHTQL